MGQVQLAESPAVAVESKRPVDASIHEAIKKISILSISDFTEISSPADVHRDRYKQIRQETSQARADWIEVLSKKATDQELLKNNNSIDITDALNARREKSLVFASYEQFKKRELAVINHVLEINGWGANADLIEVGSKSFLQFKWDEKLLGKNQAGKVNAEVANSEVRFNDLAKVTEGCLESVEAIGKVGAQVLKSDHLTPELRNKVSLKMSELKCDIKSDVQFAVNQAAISAPFLMAGTALCYFGDALFGLPLLTVGVLMGRSALSLIRSRYQKMEKLEKIKELSS